LSWDKVLLLLSYMLLYIVRIVTLGPADCPSSDAKMEVRLVRAYISDDDTFHLHAPLDKDAYISNETPSSNLPSLSY
jgi:hypothetical protein